MRNLLFFIAILFLGCESSKKRPNDFQFQIIQVTDSYNSETGQFLRESISLEPRKDTVVIENLTESELDSVYQFISKKGFFSLPEKFDCDEKRDRYVTVPSFDRTIIVKSHGRIKKVTYNDGCSPKIDLKAEEKFEVIYKKLKEVVYRRESIKNLPKTKMVFL